MRAVVAGVASLIALTYPSIGYAQEHEHEHEQGTARVEAEHEKADMEGMTGALGISRKRDGSGTAWQPDASPMSAHHAKIGGWSLMLHENIFLGYNRQSDVRGDDQLTSTNWVMFMATHSLFGGYITGRTMLSLEPLTVGGEGYPLLLQSGETFEGEPLHDRQHPHDLFMEVAAIYERELGSGIGFQLYGGPAAEPALGPVAFPHRASAMSDPLGPIGHHWLDSTHISFGVATVALFTRHVKVEGSWFNGREPDEERYDFDLRGFDSYSTRVTVNPTEMLSFQASYGFLESPEALEPEESLHKITASAMLASNFGDEGYFATTAAWGRNASVDHRDTDALLIEGTLGFDGHNTIFGRGEYARKSEHDLVIGDESSDVIFDVGSVALGYSYSFGALASIVPTIGLRGSIGIVPDALADEYGSSTPLGAMAFVRLSPEKMDMEGEHHDSSH